MNQHAIKRRSGFRWSLVTVLLARALAAQPQSSTIILTFDASSEAQKQAIAAIRAHVSGLPAEVVIVPVEQPRSLDARLAAAGALAASRRALGTFYIQMEPDGTLLIFFTEADGEATLIRRLAPNPQGFRVAFEQAGIVVRSLVEALLEGGSVGITPEGGRTEPSAPTEAQPEADSLPQHPAAGAAVASSEPPSDPHAAPSAEGPSSAPRLAISAGYTLTDFAAGMPWQSGFSGGLQWLATRAFYAGARYTLFPTYRLTTEDAEVSVARHPIEVLVGYHAPSQLAFNGELGLLVDSSRRTTVRTAPSFRATSPSARWTLALTARSGFAWSPWPRVRASVRVGADFLLTPYTYSIDSAVAVPSPHQVRPRLELELAVAIW